MSDKTKLDALARMNAVRNANTCPASRHAAMIADALVKGEPYAMLAEDPKHCGETIATVVASLWETRQMADLPRKLGDTTIYYKNRCKELEAKLAKAVDFLERIRFFSGVNVAESDLKHVKDSVNAVAEKALAEIKGESHE